MENRIISDAFQLHPGAVLKFFCEKFKLLFTSGPLLVVVGGGLGALSRYGVALFAARFFGTRFPWGTLIVNLAGCFLIGLSFAFAGRGLRIMNPSMRLFFMTGYLGGLTTFSTYALETVNAIRGTTYILALTNFLTNNLAGGALVLLGMWVGRL
ncbi:MAG: fluoride efflux transporter CrcB [Syntrophobacteraceae bacterium]